MYKIFFYQNYETKLKMPYFSDISNNRFPPKQLPIFSMFKLV
jgi:hypothetical protein